MTASRLALSEYELQHLAAHLESAGRHADLHRLLDLELEGAPGNAWYAARTAGGQVTGFLADVDRGWRAARADDSVRGQALEVQYALTAATMGSLAAAMPPHLLAQLVATGAWTADQAVSSIRRVPDPEHRVELLAGVAEATGFDGEEARRLQDEALASAEAIPDAYRRAGALARLSVNLPPDRQSLVYRGSERAPDDVELAYSTGGALRPQAATAAEAGNHADGPVTAAEVAAAVRNAPSEVAAAGRLAPLLRRLDAGGMDAAVALVDSFRGELQRTLAMARLVPRLVELNRIEQARAAVGSLTASLRVERARERLRAAAVHAAAVPPRWRAEMLLDDAVDTDDPTDSRVVAVEALRVVSLLDDADRIDELAAAATGVLAAAGCLDPAVEIATAVTSPRWRAAAATAVAGMAGVDRHGTVAQLCESLVSPLDRARALAASTPSGPTDPSHGALAEVAATATGDAAVEVAALLAVRADPAGLGTQVAGVVAAAAALPDRHRSSEILRLLLSRAPGCVEAVAQRVGAPGGDAALAEAMAVAYLRSGRPAEAVATVSAIQDTAWRHTATHWLTVRLAGAGEGAAAYELAATLPDGYLTPYLAAALSGSAAGAIRAVAFAARLADPARRALWLAAVAEAAGGPDTTAADALAAAAAAPPGEADTDRADAVVLARMAGAAATPSLSVAEGIVAPVARAVALMGLAAIDGAWPPTSPLDVTPSERCQAALRLLHLLPTTTAGPIVRDVAALVDDIADDPTLLARLLHAIGVPGTAEALTPARQDRCWSAALVAAGATERDQALSTVQALLSLALARGGPPLVVAVVDAARRVSRWWP